MNIAGIQEESITGINIAPLVDVTLVLLIIFMATAPLLQRRTIAVNVPKAAHSEPKATATTDLVLNQKHEITLAGRPVTKEELGFQLTSLLRADPALHVAVMADQDVPYGEVVELLDIARGAGVKKVAMEVRPKKAGR